MSSGSPGHFPRSFTPFIHCDTVCSTAMMTYLVHLLKSSLNYVVNVLGARLNVLVLIFSTGGSMKSFMESED